MNLLHDFFGWLVFAWGGFFGFWWVFLGFGGFFQFLLVLVLFFFYLIGEGKEPCLVFF